MNGGGTVANAVTSSSEKFFVHVKGEKRESQSVQRVKSLKTNVSGTTAEMVVTSDSGPCVSGRTPGYRDPYLREL